MGEAAVKFSIEGELPSEEFSLKKVFGAGAALMIRQVIVQFLGAVTGIILARSLSPADFGYYAIFTFGFYALLAPGDLGLGAGLVRQDTEPKTSECRNVQFVRQLVDLVLLIVIWSASPWLARIYGMSAQGETAVRLLALAIFVQSFQVVPMVLMERALRFNSIALIEVAQTLVYSVLVVYLALSGWGIVSFSLAWLAFSLTGAILANILSPWPLGWNFSLKFLRDRLPFCLPYQASGAVTLGKDAVTPVLIGIVLGATQVGYVNWAQMLAMIAALAVGVLHRVCFSAFARIRSDKKRLGEMVEMSLRLSHLFVALPSVFILFYSESITTLIFGAKWLAALPIFAALWPANFLVPTLPPLIAALNSLGRSGRVLAISVALTALFWAAAALLIVQLGVYGYPPAFLLYYVSSLSFARELRKCGVSFSVFRAAFPVWVAAFAVVLAVVILDTMFGAPSAILLGVAFITAGILYLGVLFALNLYL
ncbi:MAG: oligosaccharide flippase family protein [Bdellovibrionales bacterium]|nr:oligosaccharide flippase family protein [Bdellovibrionales bacterium]